MLRSKDMDQNSYDSGDWFNKIDWTGQTANWGIGLPISQPERQGSGRSCQPLLRQPLRSTPQPANIGATTAAFQEFMQIRYSSGLFRMSGSHRHPAKPGPSSTPVQDQTPGVIVMKLDNNAGHYDGFNHVVAVFNATNSTINFADPHLAGMHLHLHPVLQHSSDPGFDAVPPSTASRARSVFLR